MFIALLVVTFLIAAAACAVVVRAFSEPVAVILTRVVADELAMAWQRYVLFALYLVGINGGVRIWQLERFVSTGTNAIPLLTADRWAQLRVRGFEIQTGRVVTPSRAA